MTPPDLGGELQKIELRYSRLEARLALFFYSALCLLFIAALSALVYALWRAVLSAWGGL